MSGQLETLKRQRWVRGMAAEPSQEEIEVDIYAGAGGASTGIEAVTGRAVAVAINHSPYAISMHKLNHEATNHFCCDVREVDPRGVMPGRPIGLLHLSPDCTHHSRAKGGKPVQRHIRALANVGIVWATARLPRVITLENVAEFLDWGPLKKMPDGKMRPDSKRKGQSFKLWVRKLKALGYAVDWRLLRAADFGAPTIRRRLFLVARRDGELIRWPNPTHAPADKAQLLGLKPWRSAAECIDWSALGKSIFDRKRPLAKSTMRRLAKGTVKHVLRSKRGPFIVGQGGPVFSGKPVSADQPLGTITKESHRAVAAPFLATLNHSGGEFRGQDVQMPLPTLTASRDAHGLTSAFLAQMSHYSGEADRTRNPNEPMQTLTSHPDRGDQAVSMAFLAGVGGRAGQSPTRTPDQPMRTTTSKADDALAAVFLQGCGGRDDQRPPRGVDEPARTITRVEGEALAAVCLLKNNTGSDARSATEPLNTLTTTQHEGVIAASLVRFKKNSAGSAPEDPVPTITQMESDGISAAFLAKHYTGVVGQDVDTPLGTVTGSDHHSLQLAFLEKMHGTASGADPRAPMPTIQAQGNHIAEVRLFLKEFLEDYDKLTDLEKLGILEIDGQLYQITDITLRMLEPEELLKAQFGVFAEGYVLTGTKKNKVAAIGNSVPPEMEKALILANYRPRTLAAAA